MGAHLIEIIKHKGAIVPKLGDRNGRRRDVRKGHGGKRTKKPDADDNEWWHPDAVAAREVGLTRYIDYFYQRRERMEREEMRRHDKDE